MVRKRSPFALPAPWRWITQPILAIAGAATIVMAWLEEAILFLGDVVSLIALPLITSVVFLFNHLVFRTTRLKSKS